MARGEEKGRNLEKRTGGKVKDNSKVMDVNGLKELVSDTSSVLHLSHCPAALTD